MVCAIWRMYLCSIPALMLARLLFQALKGRSLMPDYCAIYIVPVAVAVAQAVRSAPTTLGTFIVLRLLRCTQPTCSRAREMNVHVHVHCESQPKELWNNKDPELASVVMSGEDTSGAIFSTASRVGKEVTEEAVGSINMGYEEDSVGSMDTLLEASSPVGSDVLGKVIHVPSSLFIIYRWSSRTSSCRYGLSRHC